MILCFLHQRALRRHLDDGEPLTTLANAHVQQCPVCREMLAAHLAIIKNLTATRNQTSDTPPFLHARVMSALQTAPAPSHRGALRWASAVAAFAAIVVAVLVLMPKEKTQRSASLPTLPTEIAFKSSLPPNPLETEIQNLRADTLNAAKALAANFWPDTPADK